MLIPRLSQAGSNSHIFVSLRVSNFCFSKIAYEAIFILVEIAASLRSSQRQKQVKYTHVTQPVQGGEVHCSAGQGRSKIIPGSRSPEKKLAKSSLEKRIFLGKKGYALQVLMKNREKFWGKKRDNFFCDRVPIFTFFSKAIWWRNRKALLKYVYFCGILCIML